MALPIRICRSESHEVRLKNTGSSLVGGVCHCSGQLHCAMARKCICNGRARADGSCSDSSCPKYRASGGLGRHWFSKRLFSSAGANLAKRVGGYAIGGYILTLQHRHDVRVGIASGMFLKETLKDAVSRMFMLLMIFPCYWKWSTKVLLEGLVASKDDVLGPQPLARKEALKRVWAEVKRQMDDYEVVSWPKECRVELETDYSSACEAKQKGGFVYDPFRCPGVRQTGSETFDSLTLDVDTGRLRRLCERLVQSLQSPDVSYTTLMNLLEDSGVDAVGCSADTSARCAMWLLRAEGVRVEPSEEDWRTLLQVSKVLSGAKAAKLRSYEDALDLFRALEKVAADIGARVVDLGDVACLLCFSSHREVLAVPREDPQLPPAASRVTVEEDLNLNMPPASLRPTKRRRIIQKTGAVASAAAAASSAAASGADAVAASSSEIRVFVCPHTRKLRRRKSLQPASTRPTRLLTLRRPAASVAAAAAARRFRPKTAPAASGAAAAAASLSAAAPAADAVAASSSTIRNGKQPRRRWKSLSSTAASGADAAAAAASGADAAKAAASGADAAAASLVVVFLDFLLLTMHAVSDSLDVRSVARLAACCTCTHERGGLMDHRTQTYRVGMRTEVFNLAINDKALKDIRKFPYQVDPSRLLRIAQVAWTWLEEFPNSFFGPLQCDGGSHRRHLVIALVRCAARCKLDRDQQLKVLTRVGMNLDPEYDPETFDSYVMDYVKKSKRYGCGRHAAPKAIDNGDGVTVD